MTMSRAAVWVLATLLPMGAARADPPPAQQPATDVPLSVAEARALLPEAASMNPAILDEVVALGALVQHPYRLNGV
jgi:hypothetical protein